METANGDPLPSISDTQHTWVSLRHPAYQTEGPGEILHLPKVDRIVGRDPPSYGIHCATLMAICFIISGNRSGFLSSQYLGESRGRLDHPPDHATYGLDDILEGDVYFYYLSGELPNYKYTVHAKFDKWSYPEFGNLIQQPFWTAWTAAFGASSMQSSSIAASRVISTVQNRDGACVLTGAKVSCGCQVAHLIPAANNQWFAANQMKIYGFEQGMETTPTNRPSNLCVLRADIHQIFDQRCFIFTPKNGQLVAHFLGYKPAPAYRYLHNSAFHNHQSISSHYILARVAWTVLPCAEEFAWYQNEYLSRSRGEEVEGQRKQRRGGGPGGSIAFRTPGRGGSNESNRDPGQGAELGREIADLELPPDSQAEMTYEELALLKFPQIFGTAAPGNDSDISFNNPESCDSSPQAKAIQFIRDTLPWYPGVERVEQMKMQYMANNPQIREVLGPCVADDCDFEFE